MKKKNKGLTIIELIITIFVLIIGILGVYNVINQPILQTRRAMIQLTASYFAQEKIEEIRNKRDQNWILGLNWANGIVDESEFNQISYIDGSITTLFSRESSLTINGDILEIKVEVCWDCEGGVGCAGSCRSVIVQENLYNWFE